MDSAISPCIPEASAAASRSALATKEKGGGNGKIYNCSHHLFSNMHYEVPYQL